MKHTVKIVGCPEAKDLCNANGLDGLDFEMLSTIRAARIGPIVAYLLRILQSVRKSNMQSRAKIVYSSSDFLTDVIPAALMKRGNPRAIWIAGFYLKAEKPRYPWQIRSLAYFVSQRVAIKLMRKADLIHVVSVEDQRYLGHLVHKPAKIITPGVDQSLVAAATPLAKRFSACFVGRFHSQKGLDDLIAAWRLVVNRQPKATLTIIGHGSVHWTNWLTRRIKEERLNNNVVLFGFLDEIDKFRIMKSCRVFVFPSRRESYGIVVIEALACGMPVIAYDIPAVREHFREGVLMAPSGNVSVLADTIISVLKSRAKYEQLHKRALAFSRSLEWHRTASGIMQELRPRLNGLVSSEIG